MRKKKEKIFFHLTEKLNQEYDKRPYTFSALFSVCILVFTIFFAPPVSSQDMDDITDTFELLNINKISLPKRKTKKNLDADSETEESDDVERAEGEVDDALDLAFYPDIVPPRPIGALKKIYPESARQREVEAVAYVSIVIDKSGKVIAVQVLKVVLSKSFPADLEKSLIEDFRKDTIKILSQAKFTSTMMGGKPVSVIRELSLKFELK